LGDLFCYPNLDKLEENVDGIYTSNVLEHIEDDQTILNTLYSKLNPGGTLIVYVPAFMLLYSNVDKSVGHYRRYHRHELIHKLKQAQFQIVVAKYCDSIGFLAWLWLKLMKTQSENNLDAKMLAMYDRFIFPISRVLDKIGLEYFFGKNVFVVATK
jgi:predicted SAM-dependent methyltransferase